MAGTAGDEATIAAELEQLKQAVRAKALRLPYPLAPWVPCVRTSPKGHLRVLYQCPECRVLLKLPMGSAGPFVSTAVTVLESVAGGRPSAWHVNCICPGLWGWVG